MAGPLGSGSMRRARVLLTAIAGLATALLAACAGGSSAATPGPGPAAAGAASRTQPDGGRSAPSTAGSSAPIPTASSAPTPTVADATAPPSQRSALAPGGPGYVPPFGAPTPHPGRRYQLYGIGAPLYGSVFPADNAWNTRVDSAPVDPSSATLIASIGTGGHLHADFGANWNGGPFGIPYVVVGPNQARVPVSFDYADQSDKGPYPIPPNAPVEGGANASGDRHVIVVDASTWTLYELFDAHPVAGGASWHAGSGAVFDLSSNALRPAGWTSADAAGLPILPGLVRYDEVAAGQIDHALRFTVAQTRRAYVDPARHYASSSTSAALPPMGMRVRLKASYDISHFPAQAKVVLQALKTYGMIVADNGSSWYLSGAPDSRWNDDDLNTLKTVPGSAFEVVAMGTVHT